MRRALFGLIATSAAVIAIVVMVQVNAQESSRRQAGSTGPTMAGPTVAGESSLMSQYRQVQNEVAVEGAIQPTPLGSIPADVSEPASNSSLRSVLKSSDASEGSESVNQGGYGFTDTTSHGNNSVPRLIDVAPSTGAAVHTASRPSSRRRTYDSAEPTTSAEPQPLQATTQPLQATTQPTYQSNGNPQFREPQPANTGIQMSEPQVTGEATPGATAIPNKIQVDFPSLKLECIAPRAVDVGDSQLVVLKVSNPSTSNASGVVVQLNVPEGVSVSPQASTAGTTQNNDGVLEWILPGVTANGMEQLQVAVTAHQKHSGTISVQMMQKPLEISSDLAVRQPELTARIVGKTEMIYGDRSMYKLVVANPGDGTAKNVAVRFQSAPGIPVAERSLGLISPGSEKTIDVEVPASVVGNMPLSLVATADAGLSAEADADIAVRRAKLNVEITGAPLAFAGSPSTYRVKISNQGDAPALRVAAKLRMPEGTAYKGDSADIQAIAGGLMWQIESLAPGQERQFDIPCIHSMAGLVTFEAGTQAADGLTAQGEFQTTVQSLADLKLFVNDPQGPQITGSKVTYEIHVKNRGTKAAKMVDVVAQFSAGIDPLTGEGHAAKIDAANGQVIFSTLETIPAGSEVVLKVTAQATEPGNHVFRAQVQSGDPETRLIAEDTTQFFGNATTNSTKPATAGAGSLAPPQQTSQPKTPAANQQSSVQPATQTVPQATPQVAPQTAPQVAPQQFPPAGEFSGQPTPTVPSGSGRFSVGPSVANQPSDFPASGGDFMPTPATR